jgi:hypothetical protein
MALCLYQDSSRATSVVTAFHSAMMALSLLTFFSMSDVVNNFYKGVEM